MNAKNLQLILCMGGFVLEMGAVAATATQLSDQTAQTLVATDNAKKLSNGKNPASTRKGKQSRKKLKQNEPILITIDGGSATKKSPIAKSLAEKFNLIYVESGAIYRTIAHVLLKHNLEPRPENKQKIEDFLKNVPWKVVIKNRYACFIVDNEILSDKELRSESLNATVALYASQFESVHDFGLKIARKALDYIRTDGFDGIIAEGRTCGTKTFPEADLKFWFSASAKAKIDFRLGEEKEVDDPLKRDELDKASPFAPLTEPEGAIHIWTHSRSLADNIHLISAFVEQKIDEKTNLLN
ncbi:MAG: (d)CMP kinase [Puniceicoccales bacterium]|jgi:cytidylate kinase|nr:(d)CMP kinase [Puniceicoccales bacterium]